MSKEKSKTHWTNWHHKLHKDLLNNKELIPNESNLLIAVVYAFIGATVLTSQSASLAFIGIAVIPFFFWLLAKRYF